MKSSTLKTVKLSTEEAIKVARSDSAQLFRKAETLLNPGDSEATINDKAIELSRAAAKQLASDYSDVATRLQAASEAALNLIGQASVAEAQLHEVQFMLLRRLGKELGRAEGDVPTMEEAVKLKGPRWMLEMLMS